MTGLAEQKKHVEALIAKASRAEKSEDAMRFSQAAGNAANALCLLLQIQITPER